MTAEEQEQLWVGLPLVLRTVGEEDAGDMIDRAQALVERDAGLLGRIVGASARLELVDRLRVERTLEGQDIYATREWREIDQLTAFLAASCVPIVQPPPDSLPDSAFQQFVADLPGWARDWLGRQYMVLPANASPESSLQAWLGMATDKKCELIAAHFAAMTRRFLVAVDYVPFDEHDRLHLAIEMRDAPFEFAWVHKAGESTLLDEVGVGEVGVGIKSGLAEAEALRFLLVITFRGWLGAQDDDTLVDRYWTRRDVRVWALRAIKELEANLHHIHAWAGRALYDRPDQADYMPIIGLSDAAARKLLSDRADLTRFGGMSPDTLDAYLSSVSDINERVFRLNQRFEEPDFDFRGKAAEEETFFSAVVAERQTRALLGKIQQIHYELTRALAAAL